MEQVTGSEDRDGERGRTEVRKEGKTETGV